MLSWKVKLGVKSSEIENDEGKKDCLDSSGVNL